MKSAQKRVVYSKKTSNTVLIVVELGIYPLKTNGDMGKRKRQCKVRNMPRNRLPAEIDRVVWKKVTKRQAGIRWDSIVKKVWKGIGGN